MVICSVRDLWHLCTMLNRFFAFVAILTLFTAPLTAQETLADPPVKPTYETVSVVIETTMGTITIALETERAPISSANFLKYADEKRFDGTVFYRAMSLDWGTPPNGLIQGGTQYDPKRILDPIAHEPTSETGVTHKIGAISMARHEVGSATGDFSIMVSPQPGLDANPESETANGKAGYAAFGFVTDGMNVVRTIFAGPIDHDKGEGWMKGQILANPVKILSVRRVTVSPPETSHEAR